MKAAINFVLMTASVPGVAQAQPVYAKANSYFVAQAQLSFLPGDLRAMGATVQHIPV